MYLTAEYLQEAFGAEQVEALCPTAAELARVIQQATTETETALQNGGYSSAVPSSVYTQLADVDPEITAAGDCPGSISLLAFGAWIELAHGRRTLVVPEQYAAYIRKLDQVRNGKMDLPGVSKDTARAVGGVSWTESDPNVTGSHPQVFRRSAWRDGGWG